MPAVAMSPAAGAHGELCGLLAIHAAHEANGQGARKTVLVPTSAHGTNPATAALRGYQRRRGRPRPADGRVDIADLAAKLRPAHRGGDGDQSQHLRPVRARRARKSPRLTHAAGAYFYRRRRQLQRHRRPGAPRRPGRRRHAHQPAQDLLHPPRRRRAGRRSGGAVERALAPFAPEPLIVADGEGLQARRKPMDERQAFGRMTAFHGQMGMFVRAYAYMLEPRQRRPGSGGRGRGAERQLHQGQAVRGRERPPSRDGPCMHEALFDDAWLEGTGVTTLDFAKALIDEGFHPMTMYFPLVAHGAMLIEPTETESRAEIDRFCDAVLALAAAAKSGDRSRFTAAPHLADAPAGRNTCGKKATAALDPCVAFATGD